MNQVDLGRGFNDLNQLSDDRMVKFSQNVDFTLQIFNFVGFVQPLFFIYFDSYFLVCPSTQTHLDHPVGALPQLCINLVLFEHLLIFELDIHI